MCLKTDGEKVPDSTYFCADLAHFRTKTDSSADE